MDYIVLYSEWCNVARIRIRVVESEGSLRDFLFSY